jgi:hypothetical protein
VLDSFSAAIVEAATGADDVEVLRSNAVLPAAAVL